MKYIISSPPENSTHMSYADDLNIIKKLLILGYVMTDIGCPDIYIYIYK